MLSAKSVVVVKAYIYAALCLILFISGCDSARRDAFIAFLDDNIVNRQELSVPIIDNQQRQPIGEKYTSQYLILQNFYVNTVQKIVSDLNQQSEALSSLPTPDKYELLNAFYLTSVNLSAKLENDLAAANAAKDKVDQPAKLKLVYDKAYEKVVTSSASVLKELCTASVELAEAKMAIALFAREHSRYISVVDGGFEVKNKIVHQQFQPLLDTGSNAVDAFASAQRKLYHLGQGVN